MTKKGKRKPFYFWFKEKSVYLCTTKNGDSVAQLVEHNTFNVGVLGSSPRRITKKLDKTRQRKDNSYNIKVLQEFFLCIKSVT